MDEIRKSNVLDTFQKVPVLEGELQNSNLDFEKRGFLTSNETYGTIFPYHVKEEM